VSPPTPERAPGTVAPMPAAPPTADGVVSHLRRRLSTGVTVAMAGRPAGEPVEVTLALLRRAAARPDTVGATDEPFAWKPLFARRSLGLAAVQACAEGRFRAPADAVGPLAEHAVDEWRRTGWRTFHWEPWFAGLGRGARAVVLAEATTWATPLWASADWAALGARARIGGPDDLWTCPGTPAVRMKGRCEARVAPIAGDAGPALVSVSCGSPSDAWADELGFLALVTALATPGAPLPSRVAGLWPDAGLRLTVDVDEASLSSAADRVVTTVALVARARTGDPSASEQAPEPVGV
jgi:hypothetical protein